MEHIVTDPNVCGGKPTVRGTRIMVRIILGMVAAGYTVERIVQEYPELSPQDVQAALEYAADVIDEGQVLSRV